MPTCRGCDSKFSVRLKIDGRWKNLRNRLYCLTCSPFKSKRGGWENIEGTIKQCSVCLKDYDYRRGKGHRHDICNTCIVNKYRRGKKQKCVEYKGGCCCRCGYNKSLNALEFHHRNSKDKKFAISGSAYTRKWESLKTELDKCDILCANCHRETHDVLLA